MTAVISFTGFLCLRVLVVWNARRVSRNRRRRLEARQPVLDAASARARARLSVGMGARHPETPGTDDAEAVWLDALLNHINTPGGQP